MQLILEMIVRYSFWGMFIFGGLLIVWIIIVGFPLIILTPQPVKDYWFLVGGTKVESDLATGWDFVALILRFSVVHSVAFPWLGKKRGLTKIREVCPTWFVHYCLLFSVVTSVLMVAGFISTFILIIDSYFLS